MTIRIDDKLRKLLRPLGADEMAQLERSLLDEGCREPLVVWKVGDDEIVLDGHNRLDICQRHQIPYTTQAAKNVKTRDQAEDWIDANQLARRNLNADQFALVLGRRYNRQKGQGKRTDLTSDQNDRKLDTSQRLAKEYGYGEATVRRAGQFAEAVEAAKAIDPEIESKIGTKGAPSRNTINRASKLLKHGEKDKAKRMLMVGKKTQARRKGRPSRHTRLTTARRSRLLEHIDRILEMMNVQMVTHISPSDIRHELKQMKAEVLALTPVDHTGRKEPNHGNSRN